jgi:hypothetical protein
LIVAVQTEPAGTVTVELQVVPDDREHVAVISQGHPAVDEHPVAVAVKSLQCVGKTY